MPSNLVSPSQLSVVAVAITLLCSACSPNADPIVLQCENPAVEQGNYASRVAEAPGRGQVTVRIEPSGNRADVVFAESVIFSGKLELDHDIFVAEDFSAGAKYPKLVRRLKVTRHTGEGFFQSSSYANGDSTPDFQTYRLVNCAALEKRF
ncbi:hypothetical protein ACW73L_05425 [Methylolobus aquaticus]